MKNLKIGIITISILLNIILIYVFIFKGDTVESNDNRTELVLSESNRDFVLEEMRDFLESVQQINEGVLKNNPEMIIKAARFSGGSAIEHAPTGMLKSLPLGFKEIGFATHDTFDEIALTAETNYDGIRVQTQLNTLLNKCTACHQSFKISTNYSR